MRLYARSEISTWPIDIRRPRSESHRRRTALPRHDAERPVARFANVLLTRMPKKKRQRAYRGILELADPREGNALDFFFFRDSHPWAAGTFSSDANVRRRSRFSRFSTTAGKMNLTADVRRFTSATCRRSAR